MNKKNYLYLIAYFIMISFLHPRGFEEVLPGYKTIFTLCTWASCAMILIIVIHAFLKQYHIYKFDLLVAFTFILIFLITLIDQKGIGAGKQQLFAFPFISFYTVYEARRKPINFCNIINNILIIILSLNLIINFLYPFEEHITFLGHVQVIAQYGILSVFTSVLILILGHKQYKKTIFQIVLTMTNLVLTDASSALLTFMLFVLFSLIYIFREKQRKLWNLLLKNSTLFYCSLLILNVIFMFIACNISIFRGFISGRDFIWQEAFTKIQKHWLLGYGIQGVLIKPFWLSWTTSNGFNYGHNQIIQLFLDGGLIWFAYIILILYFLLKKVKISNQNCLYLLNTTLIAFLVFMIFESPSVYCYIYIYISFIYGLGIKYQRKDDLYGCIKCFKQRIFQCLLSVKNKKKSG